MQSETEAPKVYLKTKEALVAHYTEELRKLGVNETVVKSWAFEFAEYALSRIRGETQPLGINKNSRLLDLYSQISDVYSALKEEGITARNILDVYLKNKAFLNTGASVFVRRLKIAASLIKSGHINNSERHSRPQNEKEAIMQIFESCCVRMICFADSSIYMLALHNTLIRDSTVSRIIHNTNTRITSEKIEEEVRAALARIPVSAWPDFTRKAGIIPPKKISRAQLDKFRTAAKARQPSVG